MKETIKEVEGDLISLALKGDFDVIAHGCNCFCTQKAGIARQMALTFNTDQYYKEHHIFRGDRRKLGTIDSKVYHIMNGRKLSNAIDLEFLDPARPLHVVNCYTQYNYGPNHKDGDPAPIDYDALASCMRELRKMFSAEDRIGLPMIGAGLAGGDWNRIQKIISQELEGYNITVVKYKK